MSQARREGEGGRKGRKGGRKECRLEGAIIVEILREEDECGEGGLWKELEGGWGGGEEGKD